jgi:predicted DNA-binding transcriptional regulator YafY
MNGRTNTELAFKRRLTLLAMLHRRSHRYDEIIAALDKDLLFGEDLAADRADRTHSQKYRHRFRNDLRALKQLGCLITCDRKTRCYSWPNSPFGLSLSDPQLEILSLLCDTFADATMPHADDIRALLTFFIERLPPKQQKMVSEQRRAFNIDLHETTDYRHTDPETLRQIEMAIQCSQQLAFTYCAPYKGQERRHVIDSHRLVFQQGHVYLIGRSVDGNKELRFRLDYIVPGSALRLHTENAKVKPFSPSYELRYWLSPVLARHTVSSHFPDQHVEKHADGSATVTARITDLFEARRILLAYGYNCIVQAPPELLVQMRQIRDHFNKSYPTPDI